MSWLLSMQRTPSMMPTGDEMFRLLKALDLAYQCEMIIVSTLLPPLFGAFFNKFWHFCDFCGIQFQLHSLIFWTSLLEILIWITVLVVFFAVPEQLGLIWLTAGHMGRGAIGFLIMFKFLPQTHEVIEDLDFGDLTQSNMSVESLS